MVKVCKNNPARIKLMIWLSPSPKVFVTIAKLASAKAPATPAPRAMEGFSYVPLARIRSKRKVKRPLNLEILDDMTP